jgi:hypothetical protein
MAIQIVIEQVMPQIGQNKSEEEERLPASLGLVPGGSSMYAAFHLLLLASAFGANMTNQH